jgi:short-subunit dehydrogenase
MPIGSWSRALITGATVGIGRAFADQLAAAGTDLVLVARNRQRLDDVATELSSKHGVTVEALAADLASSSGLNATETRLGDSTRPVDLLVNNAGFGTSGRFSDLPVDSEDNQIRLNVLALVRLTHAALETMHEIGTGFIVNVASVAGLAPAPHNATYAATKAFVISFSEALHEEERARGISVTALLPGFTRTEFQARANYDTSRVPRFMWMEADEVARAALAGAAAGKAVVVPGWIYQAGATLVHLTPRSIVRRAAKLF